MNYDAEALRRHRETRGKVGIYTKMPLETREDLSVAYTPGVAAVSMAIARDPQESFAMTNRANTVAVITDGSEVLGLGNIGPEAAMPVMEGNAALFKRLAGIDAFPICLATQDTQAIIDTVRYLAPSFGSVNLEDISAPRCFEIEDRLQDLGIPVFHDDQHGTAVVLLAALMNALRVVDKDIGTIRVAFSGAGAAAMACARYVFACGATNVTLVDSQGIINRDREGLTSVKTSALSFTNPDELCGGMSEAMAGADVFVGLSRAGVIDEGMVSSMADRPIVFAMANPEPEIMPDKAYAAGAALVGTGRSDLPNQVNNSLGFPGIFRGALDARATRITHDMKVAASEALAALVEHPTADRILPDTLDPAVVPAVSRATHDAWVAETGSD